MFPAFVLDALDSVGLCAFFSFLSTVESGSKGAEGLTEQSFYAPGVFVGNVLVSPHWSLSVGHIVLITPVSMFADA
jgi:hypothetical protein